MSSLNNIQILKQTVQAKSRALSARWTFESRTNRLSLAELIREFYIVDQGIMVGIYEDTTNAVDWLIANVTSPYVTYRYFDDVLNAEAFRKEIYRRAGVKPKVVEESQNLAGVDIESMIANDLAQAISAEIDREFLEGAGVIKKKPSLMVYFLDPHEAVRFKLSCGGE